MALFGKKIDPEFEKLLAEAEEENAQAQFEVAVAYAEGNIVKKNQKEAVYWMMLAAENEHIEAMWHGAGELERNGTWEGDPEKAFGWYLKSAEGGFPQAMYDVAIAYKNGEIVEADPSKSFEWYLKAAENGIVDAMYSVALRYEAGEVVPINFEKALYWTKQCQLNGYEGKTDLDEWIEEIEEEIRTNPTKENYGLDDQDTTSPSTNDPEPESSNENDLKFRVSKLNGSINATIEAKFRGVDIHEGHLYIAAIKTKEAALVSDRLETYFKNEPEQKRVVLGAFWEEGIEYNYSYDQFLDVWEINVSGSFTFELMDETGRDGIDVDDGPIDDLVVVFRIDGDSPPVFPSQIINSYGNLSETEEEYENDFEERESRAGNPDTPGKELENLAADDNEDIRLEVAKNENTPPHILEILSDDRDDNVRFGVAVNENTPAPLIKKLANDDDEGVRGAVARNPNTPTDVLETLARDNDYWPRDAVAANEKSPQGSLELLAGDVESNVRSSVAANPNTPISTIEVLARDDDEDVRKSIAGNARTPASILEKFATLNDETFRIPVAGNPNTPELVLEALSGDDDENVRLAVAENVSAPSPLLEKLSRLDNEDIRCAVAENISTSPSILEVLASDDSDYVRNRVSTNSNTATDLLESLAEDSVQIVRMGVASNLNTPDAILTTLMGDEDGFTAESAKRNAKKRGLRIDEQQSTPNNKNEDTVDIDDMVDLEETSKQYGIKLDNSAENIATSEGDFWTIKNANQEDINFPTFIALCVMPEKLSVSELFEEYWTDEKTGDKFEWNSEVAAYIVGKMTSDLTDLTRKFKELTDSFYYFYDANENLSEVGYLLENTGGGLQTFLTRGGSNVLDEHNYSFLTFSKDMLTKKLAPIFHQDNFGDTLHEIRIRLVRVCGFEPDIINVEIDDLAEFAESDSDESFLLNSMSSNLDSDLGELIEAFVGNFPTVVDQDWEDGDLGSEGHLSDPYDDDYKFEPNNNATVLLLSSIFGERSAD